MAYSVSVHRAAPRQIAAVRQRMPIRDVSSQFRVYLDQVYAAARGGALALDGQNVFVYHALPDGMADVDFGVGVGAPFEPVGRVVYTHVPGGDVATATHWGDYGGIGAAHAAVVEWCRAEQRTLAGVSWEIYGHWSDDPSKVRTDICYLLG